LKFSVFQNEDFQKNITKNLIEKFTIFQKIQEIQPFRLQKHDLFFAALIESPNKKVIILFSFRKRSSSFLFILDCFL